MSGGVVTDPGLRSGMAGVLQAILDAVRSASSSGSWVDVAA